MTPPHGSIDLPPGYGSPERGYAMPPEAYEAGVWTLPPRRVLAWDDLTANATRFTLDRP